MCDTILTIALTTKTKREEKEKGRERSVRKGEKKEIVDAQFPIGNVARFQIPG